MSKLYRNKTILYLIFPQAFFYRVEGGPAVVLIVLTVIRSIPVKSGCKLWITVMNL